jgi:succinyl-CoA synthetase beta subunit
MGYIVDLTVILDAIFCATSGNVSRESVQLVIDWFVSSRKRAKIHCNIRGFVTQAFAVRYSVSQKDIILERIIDLIQEFCVSAGGSSTALPAESQLTDSHVARRHGRPAVGVRV